MKLKILAYSIAFLVVACDNQPAETIADRIDANQAKWAAEKSHAYSFQFSRSCECSNVFTGPFAISVVNDSIDSIYSFAESAPLPDSVFHTYYTIAELFDFLRVEDAKQPYKLTIEFDPVLGFPMEAFIDYNQEIADDELFLKVDSVKIRQ